MNDRSSARSIVKLEEGIYLIPGLKFSSCHVYVLKGSNKIALIDVGMAINFDVICACLAEIGLSIDDIGIVVLTHEHIDHVGGLGNFPKHIVVAAHYRAANKLRLDDQFSMLSGAYGAKKTAGHVDIHLEDGTLIDLGGIQLRAIYTPGHCSGAMCLFEPNRGAMFTADTIFAGGILGGIFESGNISDYINSLERLRQFRMVSLYPGHGRMSKTPLEDLDRAINGASLLMSDTRLLFDTIKLNGAFNQLLAATADYSRRAAERRNSYRMASEIEASLHLDDADHYVHVINISLTGALLDREVSVEIGTQVFLTISTIAEMECLVVSKRNGKTILKFISSSADYERLASWINDNRPKQQNK